MLEEMHPPTGWSKDKLTEFIETAHRNRYATFANKPQWTYRLVRIDDCFLRIAKEWTNPADPVTPLLFLRAHSAYRAGCEHSMAGAVTDVYPALRVCLEYAGYALHIRKNPELAELWLRRHDDAQAMKTVRSSFTVANFQSTVTAANRHNAKIFSALYQRTIDFGAHPNERAVTASLQIADLGDAKSYKSMYLHGDGPALEDALKTTAQVGVCTLYVLRDVFPERFEILGVNAELLELRNRL